MNNNAIVQKLVQYTDKVCSYCEGLDYPAFQADSMLVEACVFNLSQMGELVAKLDENFTDRHTDIPWRAIRGLRNRIVHDYEGVNLKLVWDIIQSDLPELRTQLVNL